MPPFSHILNLVVDDLRVHLRVEEDVLEKLNRTCFRGRDVLRAGNFFKWQNFEQFFIDMEEDIEDSLVDTFIALLSENPKMVTGRDSVEIDDLGLVGWSVTDDISHYNERTELAPFFLNHAKPKRGHALLVANRKRLAPLTSTVTLVFKIRRERLRWMVRVISIYAGPSVGDHYGEVTEREKRVFFNFSHPGQPAHEGELEEAC